MDIGKGSVANMKKLVKSAVVSCILIVLLCLTTHSNVYVVNTLCLWILGWLYLSIFCYKITFAKKIKSMRVKEIIINKVVSFIISLLILLLIPIKYGDVLTHNHWEKQMFNSKEIVITPLISANVNATAKEIWIEKILLDYQKLDVNSLELPKGWHVMNEGIYAADAASAEKIIIDISDSNISEVVFAATEASGMVDYAFGESSIKVDLYSSERKSVSIEPEEIWGQINEAPAIDRLIYYGAYLIVLWLIVDGIWLCLLEYNHKRKNV